MSDEQRRAQDELNRQALVSLGIRLAEVETKLTAADGEIAELATGLRRLMGILSKLQEIVEGISERGSLKKPTI